MKNIKIVMMMMIVGAAFLSGCAATKQARSLEVSGFLNEYRSQLKPGGEVAGVRQVLMGYVNPNLKDTFKKYHKVLLAPISVWDDPKQPLTDKQRNDYLVLADSFHALLSEQLSKNYEMVEEFGPDTIYFRVAIIHGEKHTVGLSFISKVVPQARVLNAVWSFATGKPAFTGEVDVEAKLTDAVTGELLAAGADRRVGGQKLLEKNVFDSWGDVQNSFTYWGELTVFRFCNWRGDANCVKPKA